MSSAQGWKGWLRRPVRWLLNWLDNEDWQRRHFMLAPFGITAMVFLLTHYYECDSRPVWKNLDKSTDYVELGTVLYGAFAVVVLEGGLQMFYFFAKRRRDLNNAQAEFAADMINLSNAEPNLTLVEAAQRVANQRGITLTAPVTATQDKQERE